jgi:hypothetical protein
MVLGTKSAQAVTGPAADGMYRGIIRTRPPAVRRL